MFIESITQASNESFFSAVASKPQTNNFEKILTDEIKKIDSAITQADNDARSFAVGDTNNLHHLMISLTKAQTSFELAVQVRNRVIEGAQELFRMSI